MGGSSSSHEARAPGTRRPASAVPRQDRRVDHEPHSAGAVAARLPHAASAETDSDREQWRRHRIQRSRVRAGLCLLRTCAARSRRHSKGRAGAREGGAQTPPRRYFLSVEAGCHAALAHGSLGFPVVDVEAVLTDGSFHTVDSADMAFRTPASLVMIEALGKGDSMLLEPVLAVAILAPSEAMSRATAIVSRSARPDHGLRPARRLGRMGSSRRTPRRYMRVEHEGPGSCGSDADAAQCRVERLSGSCL